MGKNLPVTNPDKTVPTEHQGTLEPNYYCRGWNPKREKYCSARAGQGTDHPGVGRCKNHSGNAPIKHGRFSSVVRGPIREHLERLEEESEEEQLDILKEAQMIRAIAAHFLDDYEEIRDALIEWNYHEAQEAFGENRKPRPQRLPDITDVVSILDSATKVVDRIHKQRSQNAISIKDFRRLMRQMGILASEEIHKMATHYSVPAASVDNLMERIVRGWKKLHTT